VKKFARNRPKNLACISASDKENVNRHRLKEPDKTKYEINDALKFAIPKCKNWNDLA
jgi:hypothetical protein